MKVSAKPNWFKPIPADPTNISSTHLILPAKQHHHYHHPSTKSKTQPSSIIWIPRKPEGILASLIRDIENKL